MMSLFDEEQIMKSFIKSERYEAAQESARETCGSVRIDGEEES